MELELLDRLAAQDAQIASLRHQLAVKEMLFELVFSDLPDAALLVDEAGTILRVNDALCALFGYAPDEVLGHTVEMFLPDALRVLHGQHRANYLIDPHRRRMGTIERPLYGRHRDGHSIRIDAMLGPVIVGDERLAIAIVRELKDDNGGE